MMEQNPWGGKCPNLFPQPCRALLRMPPRCHKYPSHFCVALLHRAKRTKRRKKVLDMESQDKGGAMKGDEVAMSMLSRAKETAQPEARKIQLESSQKMDWREYSYFRNNR